jgi:hypothetical protein
MDKTSVLKALNSKKVPMSKFLELISEYCYDKGKSDADTSKFLNTIVSDPMLVIRLFTNSVLPYLKLKYNIYTVLDKNRNPILFY